MDDQMQSSAKSKYTYRDWKHVLRLGVLLIIGFSVSMIARVSAVPETYYEKGRYRAAAPDKIAAAKPSFAGMAACADCHSDQQAQLFGGRHQSLRCETCHWASAEHAADPDIEPRRKVKAGGMREFCVMCHARQIGRPAFMPQIDPQDHNTGEPCSTCHLPHSPGVD